MNHKNKPSLYSSSNVSGKNREAGAWPYSKHPKKIGEYGTYLFPEFKTVGAWRLQTDFQPLIEIMKKRAWDKKSPWQTIAWGTLYIFKRSFLGLYEAKRSLGRILGKLGIKEVRFVQHPSGSFEAIPTPRSQLDPANALRVSKTLKPPPLTGKNQGPLNHFDK